MSEPAPGTRTFLQHFAISYMKAQSALLLLIAHKPKYPRMRSEGNFLENHGL